MCIIIYIYVYMVMCIIPYIYISCKQITPSVSFLWDFLRRNSPSVLLRADAIRHSLTRVIGTASPWSLHPKTFGTWDGAAVLADRLLTVSAVVFALLLPCSQVGFAPISRIIFF